VSGGWAVMEHLKAFAGGVGYAAVRAKCPSALKLDASAVGSDDAYAGQIIIQEGHDQFYVFAS
jgi:hypothetical protein